MDNKGSKLYQRIQKQNLENKESDDMSYVFFKLIFGAIVIGILIKIIF